jgi:hypothetical protein
MRAFGDSSGWQSRTADAQSEDISSTENARFWFTRGSEMSSEKCKMQNADSHGLLAECLKLDVWYLLNFSFFNNH